ncbi:MAG: hypothetical protein ACPGJS_13485 [Flammeovirgaceae bacterium]
MDYTVRENYNNSFTKEKYESFLKDIHPTHDPVLDFRIAETPLFVSKEFMAEIMGLFTEVKHFLEQPDFRDKMEKAIPNEVRVPNESQHSSFVAVDFAVCRGENGQLFPQLIELQGVASLYCYQRHLCNAYRKHFNVPQELKHFFGGIDDETYIQTLKDLIIGDEKPERVVLLDIKPHEQKTRIDFIYTEKDLGIKSICITEVIQEGRNLFYMNNGEKTPIKRIYNRVIFDELKARKDLNPQFDITSEVDVKWFAHPNWFFKISKYSMPFMNSKFVPKTFFLSDLKEYPSDLENYVLKPLFSFAGSGVIFDVTVEALDAVQDRENYILQRKVAYEPCLPTLDIKAKAEIRLLCIWEDELKPLISLARLSKGKMMGVDFNKEKTWVGGSAVFFEE